MGALSVQKVLWPPVTPDPLQKPAAIKNRCSSYKKHDITTRKTRADGIDRNPLGPWEHWIPDTPNHDRNQNIQHSS